MKSEKRMVGDYTVLCAVNIGSREIILAENEQSANGERFLCCYGERNDIFEKFTECAVGDDYIDAALFFAERIKQDAERFRAEVEKLDIPVTVITQADCIPDHYKNDINGKIIAINPAILKPEYQRADRQLFLVTGGFGASANARGSAVFCKNLYDGKNTRYERMDVLGEVKPERIEGAMYVGIGIPFLWYGYFRGIKKLNISLLLTVISLGTRVLLSYTLAPNTGFGVVAIWASIPVGWFLADIAGYIFYRSNNSVKWK